MCYVVSLSDLSLNATANICTATILSEAADDEHIWFPNRKLLFFPFFHSILSAAYLMYRTFVLHYSSELWQSL